MKDKAVMTIKTIGEIIFYIIILASIILPDSTYWWLNREW